MSDYRIEAVHGRHIHVGDVNLTETPTVDHCAVATEQLQVGCYAEAAAAYRAALAVNPGDESARYGLALSLLDGRRPRRSPQQTLIAIDRHLRAADDLPEARALRRLVLEDYELAWRRWTELPDHVTADLALVKPHRAREITEHVPAWEARVWRALHERAGG